MRGAGPNRGGDLMNTPAKRRSGKINNPKENALAADSPSKIPQRLCCVVRPSFDTAVIMVPFHTQTYCCLISPLQNRIVHVQPVCHPLVHNFVNQTLVRAGERGADSNFSHKNARSERLASQTSTTLDSCRSTEPCRIWGSVSEHGVGGWTAAGRLEKIPPVESWHPALPGRRCIPRLPVRSHVPQKDTA
jgi:hypothetical protein